MSEIQEVYPPQAAFIGPDTLTQADYQRLYAESVQEPDQFWARAAQRLHWFQPPQRIRDVSFDPDDFHVRWFEDGRLNVSYNCLDRHLERLGDKPAILWEPDDPNVPAQTVSYRELHERVCRLANVLRSLGVRKGDRVTVYLPMVIEAAVALLACSRIGAVHNVVFGGFSPSSLADRIRDCGAKLVLTADEGWRGGRRIALKSNVDAALAQPGTEQIEAVLVLRHTGGKVDMRAGRDHWWHECVQSQNAICEPESMEAEDPLFILYTSGSTGKPKGLLHTTGGYAVYASLTHQVVFDLREDDVYWCTADIGWITGHSYIVYGPLLNGATTLMFEGVPSYPDASRFWRVVDRHQVSIFYTAPTAIRALMREGEEPVKACSRQSLRVLGTVGEPINPQAWRWYHEVVGEGRCPIVDTWWQTENGGILIAPLPGATTLKPGAATRPLFGVKPALIDNNGHEVLGEGEGQLVIADSWPGQARTIYGDHQRFIDTYFKPYPGYYLTGDGARRDADGDYWITGRVDDVINVSGHRLGTAELESALVAHAKVAEAAVVGYPHDVKGQGIYFYVTLVAGIEGTDALKSELVRHVREVIGPIATPDQLQWAPALPKTRSGKIMRRILRKIAENAPDQLGDTSTLADPSVVDVLVQQRCNR
ncbi:acetate--CoA ligase [Pusillimonas sp. CC-YST705]|uniref:Acetyl-coenzyme A synthetase n=1 Tax=Mesopusillimonas faecipullorum TaxID=2755040 RepID=A0ABS8C9T1_9BURK|nr:acetate--CoA ligase [Mesopusillimonas faecipullorum]MCB5362791.1 acetate--CoA ligase [Mesopusillimonas faecipullorum]